jgi:predicted transcriptional regulator
MANTAYIQARIPAELQRQVEAIAQQADRSIAYVVRWALEEFVERNQDKENKAAAKDQFQDPEPFI